MNQSKKVPDGALLLAVFIVLMLIAIFVPITISVLIFLLPVPFIIYTSKYDWKTSLFMFLVAILLSLLLATLLSLPITIIAGFGGIMIGAAIYHRQTPYETWARGTLGFIGGLLFAYLFTQYFLEINWVTEIDEMINESLQMSKDIVEQFGLTQTDEEFNLIKEQLSYITDLIPAAVAIISTLLAFIAQWISYKIMNHFENRNMKFPPFRNFKLPVALVWIYFFALLFTIFDLNPDEILFIVANNVVVLAGFLIALQGFSFIFFYAHYKSWSI